MATLAAMSAQEPGSFEYCGYAVYTQNTFLTVGPSPKSFDQTSRRRSSSLGSPLSRMGLELQDDSDRSQTSTSDLSSPCSKDLSTRASSLETSPVMPSAEPEDPDADLDPEEMAAHVLRENGTTLMVHGVPNRMMCQDLLPVLGQLGFAETDFDYMYMPLDNRAIAGLKRPSNLGYIFINCVSTELACKFVKEIYNYQFTARRSNKPVHATLAITQGVKQNLHLLVASWRKTKRLRKSRANAVCLRQGSEWQQVPVEKLRFHPLAED